ncbi:DNA excision repair protein ERCC-1 [Lamellibrachia satsuma]|nr:DNA excision repair protein ERCC-1 [Lamellibrachia satsuma]
MLHTLFASLLCCLLGVDLRVFQSTDEDRETRLKYLEMRTNFLMGNSQPVVAVTTSGKTNAIIVSARQKGNPVLKCIRNVPWEFGDIVPDYQLGQTSCALFLSTRYHLLYPAYIHDRLKQLGHSFHLRALLMLIDVKDPHHALKEVAKMCILADCSLILAFSVEEAGRYLETFKSFEKKPPDLIMEKTEGNFLSQVTDVFTSARKINKTDAMTLLSTFGTVKGVVESSQDELSLCPGFGPQKAQRLHRLIHEPFIKVKKIKGSQLTDEAGHPSKTMLRTPL